MKSRTPEDAGEVTVFGVDIGKDTFHIVGFDHGVISFCARRSNG